MKAKDFYTIKPTNARLKKLEKWEAVKWLVAYYGFSWEWAINCYNNIKK